MVFPGHSDPWRLPVKQRLTHHQTQALPEVLEIGGDLLLLPEQQVMAPYEDIRALRSGRTVSPDESVMVEMVERYFPRYEDYVSHRLRTGQEPDWMDTLPMSAQRRMRFDFAIQNEDPLAIVPMYRHTGLSYMVRDGGLCEDLERLFELRRLQDVRQLGFLQAPWFAGLAYGSEISEHNRFLHSLDVMAIATVIAHNLGLDERLMNTVRTAAFSHDMGTPAGGDSVKAVDPPAFDEDARYPELIERFDYRPVFKRHGVDRELLFETIMNRGLLGEVLDIADKLAYVARDLHACEPYLNYGLKHMDQYGLESLFSILQLNPNVCGLWDAVENIGDRAVISDPSRLAVFLRVRTLLFRELYYHPNARFGEYLVSRMLVKALYDKGTLTRDQLIEMRDFELERILDEEYGPSRRMVGHPHTPVYAGRNIVEAVSRSGVERVNCYSRQEAEKLLADLRSKGRRFALIEDNTRQIVKTADHILVAVPDEREPGWFVRFLQRLLGARWSRVLVKPFSEAFPGDARELKEVAQSYPTIYVYYLTGDPPIAESRLEELAAAFRTADF